MLSNEIQKVTGHTTFVGTHSKEMKHQDAKQQYKQLTVKQNVTAEGLRYGSTATLMTPSACEAKRR